MKLLEYKDLAIRTAAKGETEQQDLMHSACGLVTEVGELVDQYKRHIFYKKEYDKNHLIEEVGDVMWYLALGMEVLKCDLTSYEEEDFLEETIKALNVESVLAALVYNSASIFACSFKYTSKDDQEAMWGHYMYYLKNILIGLRHFCAVMNIDYEESKTKNIAKLKARFPQGFTEEAAVNRNLEVEKVALES